MVYFPRRVVFPFFVAVFSLIFFSLLFIAFPNPFVDFSQGLEVSNASVAVEGDKVALRFSLKNVSNHYLGSVSVVVENSIERKTLYLKDNGGIEKRLAPGEVFEFEAFFPLSEEVYYKVFVMAPFTKSIPLDFSLQEQTINPVKAELSLPSKLFANESYKYPVKLCNVSDSDISEVFWIESSDEEVFREEFFERSVSLKKGECKTIYSTLTPISLGRVELKFTLRVGLVEKKSFKSIEIVSK